MNSEFTAPLYRILYSDQMPKVVLQGYDLNSRPYSTQRTMNPSKLPLLVFQLVEAGYAVSLEKTMGIFQETSNVLVALTPEYIEVIKERIENGK